MVITLGPLQIDRSRGCAVVHGRVVVLRPLDFRVLHLLARQPHRAWSREALAEKLWGPASAVDARAVDSCVARLRKALDGAGHAIITVRRVGYRLDPEHLEDA